MTDQLKELADRIAANVIYTQKAVLTTDEASKYMGIAKSTLYKMMMKKQIPYSQPSGKVAYFSRLQLEAWLMSNRVATEDELNERAQSYCSNNRKGGRP